MRDTLCPASTPGGIPQRNTRSRAPGARTRTGGAWSRQPQRGAPQQSDSAAHMGIGVVIQRHVIQQLSEVQPFATQMDLTNMTPNKRSQTKGVHPQCDSPSAQLWAGGRAVGRGVRGLAPHGDGRHAGTGTAQARRPHAGTPAGLPSSDWPWQGGQEGLLCLH